MVKFQTVRLGHPASGINHKKMKRDSLSCGSQAFYTTPATGTTMESSDPLTVSWDRSYASCLDNATQVDIYLLSPSAPTGHVKVFSPISFSAGSFTRSLDPSWWNSTDSIQLQISIVESGTPLYMSSLAAGPVVTVNYDSTSGSISNSTSTTDPNLKTTGGVAQSGSLSKGSIAVAILLPILVVIAAIGVYIKISRKRQAEKRRRFSQAVDARMSRISGDWQSITPHGAQTAIRHSTASGMRMSTVFVQEMQMDMRPSGERVSFAASSRPSGETIATAATRRSHFNPAERASRISFAADVNASRDRLSTYSMGRASRAFHVGVVPPVPRAPVPSNSDDTIVAEDVDESEDHIFSPIQTQGPIPLSTDDINNLDISPALHLMRTSNNPALKSSEDLLLTPLAPVHPPMSPLGTSYSAPPLSPLGVMPMQPQPLSMMSPDALLREYAVARAAGAKSPTGSISFPNSIYSPMSPMSPIFPSMSLPQYTSNGMRNLTGDASLSHPGFDKSDA